MSIIVESLPFELHLYNRCPFGKRGSGTKNVDDPGHRNKRNEHYQESLSLTCKRVNLKFIFNDHYPGQLFSAFIFTHTMQIDFNQFASLLPQLLPLKAG